MLKSFCDFCGEEIYVDNRLDEKGIFTTIDKGSISLEVNLKLTNHATNIDCCTDCLVKSVEQMKDKPKKENSND